MTDVHPEARAMSIRGIDPRVYETIRVRAARHGQSMEAEVRELMSKAADEEPEAQGVSFGDLLRSYYTEFGGVDLELPARDEPVRGAEFS